jgi:hypothetical protein
MGRSIGPDRSVGGVGKEQLTRQSNVYTLGGVVTPRKRYSFWINDVQAAGLKAVKQAEDVTESEQIRQALNDWLKKKGVMKAERRRVAARKRP